MCVLALPPPSNLIQKVGAAVWAMYITSLV